MDKTRNIGGRRTIGRNYNEPLADILPRIIGKRAKTIPEIAEEAERSTERVRTYIKKLRSEPGTIHIKAWKRGLSGGVIMPRYLLGAGIDAERLKPLTNKQRIQRYMQTDKGKAAKERAKAKRQGVTQAIAHSINAHPLMSALYS